MKVECIATSWVHYKKFIKKFFGLIKTNKKLPTDGPKEGDILTVKDEVWEEGIKFYSLIEWPKGYFEARLFRPIAEQFQEVTFEQIKKEKPISVN